MTSQGPKRKHHILPRHYLKGFAEPPDGKFIWVYERGRVFDPGFLARRHNPYRDSVAHAGAQKDFYAVRREDGSEDFETYENLVARLEARALPILAKLRNQAALTLEEKAAFASYVTLMIKRVRKRRGKMGAVLDGQLQKFPWDFLARLAAEQGRFSDAIRLTYGREVERARLKEELLVRSTVESLGGIERIIAQMTWECVTAEPLRGFATTDSPVVWSETVGLRGKEAFLIFPISVSVILRCTWLGGRDLTYVRATDEEREELNRAVLCGAVKEAYYASPESWLLEVWGESRDP